MTVDRPPVPTVDEVNVFVAESFPSSAADGFACSAIGTADATVTWRHDPERLRPGGIISGPTLFMAADLALWVLSFTVVGLQPMAVTTNMTIDFLKPAAGGDLFAKATMLRAGRSRITGRVDLWVADRPDVVVGHATGSYALLT